MVNFVDELVMQLNYLIFIRWQSTETKSDFKTGSYSVNKAAKLLKRIDRGGMRGYYE